MEPYIERQNFLKRWWLIAIPMVLVSLVPVVGNLANGKPGMEHFIAPVVIIALVLLLFAVLTLHTRIDETSITIRYSPFHRKDFVIGWGDIKTARVVKYDPLFEYGGWGFRKGWSGRKRAYNVSGRMGLELELVDGRILMIGTVRKEEMTSYLQQLRGKYLITAIDEQG